MVPSVAAVPKKYDGPLQAIGTANHAVICKKSWHLGNKNMTRIGVISERDDNETFGTVGTGTMRGRARDYARDEADGRARDPREKI